MNVQYSAAHHHDSGSDLESDSEHDRLVGSRSSGRGPSHLHGPVSPSASSSSSGRLPQCCCKITPFNGFVLLLAVMGVALLVPGVLMRLESIPSPLPLLLMQLCRQPTSFSTSTLDQFRQEVSAAGSLSSEGLELQYEGVSLSTAALSVYRGTDMFSCAEQEAFEGSPQVIPLPNTMLFTGIKYVSFLTLPTYVVGGSVALRMYSGDQLLFNVSTSLHLHRYLSRHDIQWLQASHVEDSLTKVYNPHLPPAPVHAHGASEEDCRLPGGCGYRMRAGMQSLILTNTAFELPVPPVSELEAAIARRRAAAIQPRGAHAAAERARREAALNARATAELYGEAEPSAESDEAEAEMLRLAETEEEAAAIASLGGGAGGSSFSFAQRFRQDESMLIYATNLTVVIDYALVIESNELAERSMAHTPAEHEVYDFTDGADDAPPQMPVAGQAEGQRRRAPTTFISPDVLLSFHQYELSPMQHVGVSYIIRGTALILTAAAVAFVKWSNDSERGKHKHS